MTTVPLIEQALRDGATLRAFRSGGGLRVVRLSRPDRQKHEHQRQYGKLIAYGEHPHIEEALAHCEWSLARGNHDYKVMYSGENAQFTHYLTGSPDPSSDVDRWVLDGRTFIAEARENEFRAWSDSHVIVETPQWVIEPTLTKRTTTYWEDSRGCRFTVMPSRFRKGHFCPTIKHTHVPDGVDHLFAKTESEATADNLWDALARMVAVPSHGITYKQIREP